MTIRDIANILVARHELTQVDAEHFVQAVVEVINEGLLSDKQVKIKGFGTFKLQTIKERSSISISTREKVVIGEHSKVTFTPEPIMKDLVNKPFSQFETVVIDDDSPLLEGNKDIELDEELPDDSDDTDTSLIIDPTIDKVIDTAPTADTAPTTEPLPPAEPLASTPSAPDISGMEQHVDEVVKADDDDTPAIVVEDTPDPIAENAADLTGQIPQETTAPAQPLADKETDTGTTNTNTNDAAVEVSIPADNQENDHEPTEADGQEEGEDSRPTYRNILIYHNIVINIVIAAAFFTLGYMAKAEGWFNLTSQPPIKPAATIQTMPKPRPVKPQPKDTIEHKDTITPAKTADKANHPQQTKESHEDIEAKKAAEQHSQMMQRFMANPITRTGAYNIIGVKDVAITRKGQTLKDISKSYLGPGLECYVEVLNGFTEVKEGDEVLIPRLEMKKAARKKINKMRE